MIFISYYYFFYSNHY